jgi:hypothetical protein
VSPKMREETAKTKSFGIALIYSMRSDSSTLFSSVIGDFTHEQKADVTSRHDCAAVLQFGGGYYLDPSAGIGP